MQPPATAPAAIRNRRGAVDGEITSTSFSGTLARTFGEVTRITPYVTLGYSQTETDGGFSPQGTAVSRFAIASEASGANGSVGIDLAHTVNNVLDLTGGVSFLAAEDGAASLYTARRPGGFQPSALQSTGSVQCGEIYGGLSLTLSAGASLGASVGTTLGRERDEIFGSASLSWSF